VVGHYNADDCFGIDFESVGGDTVTRRERYTMARVVGLLASVVGALGLFAIAFGAPISPLHVIFDTLVVMSLIIFSPILED
jgi:hypothetical protein